MVRSMLPRSPPVPSDCYAARASACLGILIAVPIFFFMYDAVAHRGQPSVPTVGSSTRRLVALEAAVEPGNLPNVDEHADAVIPEVRLPPAKSETVWHRFGVTKNTKVTARSKRQPARIARRHMNPEARSAYAQASPFGFAPPDRP
jgi:hypothetical protein